jgi:hypothetical protein
MAFVFAEFQPVPWEGGPLRWADGTALYLRRNTRVYAEPKLARNQEDGTCVGAFWLKNPGSATPAKSGVWGPCERDDGDQTLGLIRRLLQLLGRHGCIKTGDDPYLQILNLTYATTPAVSSLTRLVRRDAGCLHQAERDAIEHAYRQILSCYETPHNSRFVVLGWGDLLAELNRIGPATDAPSAPWLQATAEVDRMVAERHTLVIRGEHHAKPVGTTFHEVTVPLDASRRPRHPLLAPAYIDNLLRFLLDRWDVTAL